MLRLLLMLSPLCLLFSSGIGLAQTDPPKPDRWEPEIRKFEQQDAQIPPPVEANLFIGSSSVRLWKLETAFPKSPCINRGFGGSQMVDAARYVERLVLPTRPRVVVVYAGDNDLNVGKTPETILADYRVLRDKIHAALPDTRIVIVSIKPSPSRWKLKDQALQANRLLRQEAEAGKNQVYVDIWTPMLGENGEPRADLFVKDRLHMNELGYAVWNERVAPHLIANDR